MVKALLYSAVFFLRLLLSATFVEPSFFLDNTFAQPPQSKLNFETNYAGLWLLMSVNAGVSAMHLAITRNNKAIMFDSTITQTPPLKLSAGNCRPVPRSKTNEMDCSVHAVEFDLTTTISRPLKVLTDPWCSSGAFSADGTLVQAGGFMDGAKAVRYFSLCNNCDWEEYTESLSGGRWYATQVVLPDGRFIIIGGRRQFNYEFIPQAGKANQKAFHLQFLVETTDDVENNLYPFVHLSTDGNLFIFANNRAILLDPNSNIIVRNFPKLKGGSRNYPSSGMSALLPIKTWGAKDNLPIPAEVIVCGGAPKKAFKLAKRGIFLPATQNCGRIDITQPNAMWEMEQMPMPRTMGDMLILPNTELLLINGAKKGCAGWWGGREPALEPVLYRPTLSKGSRFRTLSKAIIPRMYHSTSAVLPDASILVSGSNPNNGYNYTNVLFRTEVSVEKFYPPYFDPLLVIHRPQIVESSITGTMRYGKSFALEFALLNLFVNKRDIEVTMYAPPFTTHGFSMSQRLLILKVEDIFNAGMFKYRVAMTAPPTSVIAPAGYYLVFVVNRGLPSTSGMWVHIQ